MKKVLSLFMSVVMLLSITAGIDLSAYAGSIHISSGDFSYSTDDNFKTAKITGYFGKEDSIGIPVEFESAYGTTAVTGIADYAFDENDYIKGVFIGENIINISEYAFLDRDNNEAIEDIYSSLSKEEYYEEFYYVFHRNIRMHFNVSADSFKTHYQLTNTVEKGCDNYGYNEYSCNCGESKIELTEPSTGHNFENSICQNCGLSKEEIKNRFDDNYLNIGDSLTINEVIQGELVDGKWFIESDGSSYNLYTQSIYVFVPDYSMTYDFTSTLSYNTNASESAEYFDSIITVDIYDNINMNADALKSVFIQNGCDENGYYRENAAKCQCEFEAGKTYVFDVYSSISFYTENGNLTQNEIAPVLTSRLDMTFDNLTVFYLTQITNQLNDGLMTEDEFYQCMETEYYPIGDRVYGTYPFSSSQSYYFRENVTDIIIPSKNNNGSEISKIGDGEFCGFTQLKNVSIPYSVTSIGAGAFDGCSLLESIELPDSVSQIGNQAFYECGSLTEIIINNPDCDIYDSDTTIAEQALIYGYSGSTAQAYAEKYNRQFVALDDNSDDNDESTITSIEYTPYREMKVYEGEGFIYPEEYMFEPYYQNYGGNYFANGVVNENDKLTVNYKNGTNKEYFAKFDNGELNFISLDNDILVRDDWYTNIDKGTNSFNFTYIGKSASVSMNTNVIKIKNLEYKPLSELTIEESEWYSLFSDQKILSKDDILTVIYEDGTVNDYIFTDVASHRQPYYIELIDSNGKPFEISKTQFMGLNSWSVGKDNYFTIDFPNAKSNKVPVTIIPKQAHQHSYTTVVTEPTCTEEGYTTYTCSCGDSYVSDETAALGHSYGQWTYNGDAEYISSSDYKNGTQTRICSVCGAEETVEAPNTALLRRRGNALALESSITLTTYITKDIVDYYDEVYAEFTRNGKTETVYASDKTFKSGSTIYNIFDYAGISPQAMGDDIEIKFYGIKDGVKYWGETYTYSVTTYVTSTLSKSTTSDKLKKMLVDLMYYGEACQIYQNYKTDSLMTNILTDEQKKLRSTGELNLTNIKDSSYATCKNRLVRFGTALRLNNAVEIAIPLNMTNVTLEELTFKVKIGSRDLTYTYSDNPENFEKGKDGYWYFYFDGVYANQMSDEVFITAYRGDEQVSYTLKYSVESYAATVTDSKLKKVTDAMMRYGNSAKAYSGK